MLAAESLGLGTTIIGIAPPVIDRSKKLRERYAIPKQNKFVTSLILGHPKYKYRRSIRRQFPSVRYLQFAPTRWRPDQLDGASASED